MNTADQIQKIELPQACIERCCAYPAPGFARMADGQAKALSEAALARLMNVPIETFLEDQETAHQYGVSAMLFDPEADRMSGIVTVSSIIKDDNVIDKHASIPRSHLRPRDSVSKLYVVSFFVHASKTQEDGLRTVYGVYAAGWLPAPSVHRWITKGGNGPIHTPNMFTAAVPVCALHPISTFVNLTRPRTAAV